MTETPTSDQRRILETLAAATGPLLSREVADALLLSRLGMGGRMMGLCMRGLVYAVAVKPAATPNGVPTYGWTLTDAGREAIRN